MKLHTLLDLRGNIPSLIFISDGKMHDVNILDRLVPQPGAIYVMDRGYIDFERLGRFHEAGSFFVIRAKKNLKVQRRYSRKVDRSTGLICDQTVTLTGFYSQQGYPAPLRRVRFNDKQTGKRVVTGEDKVLAAASIRFNYLMDDLREKKVRVALFHRRCLPRQPVPRRFRPLGRRHARARPH